MAVNVIRKYVIKQLSKDRGSGIMEIPNRLKVDRAEVALNDLLIRKGIDPRTIKNEGMIETIMRRIEADRIGMALKKAEAKKKMAEILDMKGKTIKNPDAIIGGTEVGMFDNIFAKMKKDMDGGKFKTVKKKETEAEIAERMKKENKESVKRFEKKMKKDDDFDFNQDPEDMASGGRAKIGYPGIVKEIETDLHKGFKRYKKSGGKKKFREYAREMMRKYFAGGGSTGGISYLLGEDTRTNFSAGGIDKVRRLFLKLMGAGAATAVGIKSGILGIGKKQAARQAVPNLIETAPAPGKPEWFDALVNKVVMEGDDVTKNFATKERQIVHKKTIDDDQVLVTQDLDEGSITIDYDSADNMMGETVTLRYKKPLPDEGDPNPLAEFEVEESGIVGRGGRSPDGDDYELEVEGVGGSKIEDLESDVSKLKTLGTGKKPTIKEIVQTKRRKDKVKRYSDDPEGQMDYVVERQGEMDYDPDVDFASGGIARLLGE